MTVSDKEVLGTLLWEFRGSWRSATRYAARIAAVNGPLAAQYARVQTMLEKGLIENNLCCYCGEERNSAGWYCPHCGGC